MIAKNGNPVVLRPKGNTLQHPPWSRSNVSLILRVRSMYTHNKISVNGKMPNI